MGRNPWNQKRQDKLSDFLKLLPSFSFPEDKTRFRRFKDGKVSVEEAFYYARYMLKTDENFEDFKKMEPQINDQYPNKGLLRSFPGMVLGE